MRPGKGRNQMARPAHEDVPSEQRLEVNEMAWRPTNYLLEGELDNTRLGKVTGWMRFAGMKNKVTFELKGDFHRDIRGTRIRFTGDGEADDLEAASYMDAFAEHQTGRAGDITAGLAPHDYGSTPYIEWFGDENGRVVIELEQSQVKVIGQLLPWDQWEPISREQQDQNMGNFLGDIARAMNVPPERVLCVGKSTSAASTTMDHKTEGNAQ